jgi:hypothetical protein
LCLPSGGGASPWSHQIPATPETLSSARKVSVTGVVIQSAAFGPALKVATTAGGPRSTCTGHAGLVELHPAWSAVRNWMRLALPP